MGRVNPSTGELLNLRWDGGTSIENRDAFELPPPGPGLTTVTLAVPAVNTWSAGTCAVNSMALTKCVTRGVPFQSTTDPFTNPAPFTVNLNPGPAGSTAAGTSG